MYSHPEYSNHDAAHADLLNQMGSNNDDFELVPHSISHTTSSGIRISTKALKIRADFNTHKEVFSGLIKCLAKGPADAKLRLNSTSTKFKLIPFANNTFSTDQTTMLIQKQNDYLHDIRCISVVNLGNLEGTFKANTQAK